MVTYMRLVEGGSLAIGDGEGRGYIEVCEGLSVKTWSKHRITLHITFVLTRRTRCESRSLHGASQPCRIAWA